MVRYMRSWFRAPRTGTPSAAAWARILSRSVRICIARGGREDGKDGSAWGSLSLCGLQLALLEEFAKLLAPQVYERTTVGSRGKGQAGSVGCRPGSSKTVDPRLEGAV